MIVIKDEIKKSFLHILPCLLLLKLASTQVFKVFPWQIIPNIRSQNNKIIIIFKLFVIYFRFVLQCICQGNLNIIKGST